MLSCKNDLSINLLCMSLLCIHLCSTNIQDDFLNRDQPFDTNRRTLLEKDEIFDSRLQYQ